MEHSESSVLFENDSLVELKNVIKDDKLSNTLYDLLYPSVTDMLLNMIEVYDTKKALLAQLDSLIKKLQTHIHLVNPEILEEILTESIHLRERMNLICKTLKEVQSRIEKYALANTGIFNEEWTDWKLVFKNRLKKNLWLFEPSKSCSEAQNGVEVEDGIPSSVSELEKALFYRITNVLLSNFSSYPPHTVQRLAELLLTPKLHYNSLLKYLRAVEKTVMVTSTTVDFQVSQTNSESQTIDHNDSNAPNLTPISWIFNDQNIENNKI
ncbi:hypothetical protein PMAC_000625 [Pneumocystis sp. 'macacae']|nr:hypothetical protein PMAC_000625 [Pneumocystis sp. 'macacae']